MRIADLPVFSASRLGRRLGAACAISLLALSALSCHAGDGPGHGIILQYHHVDSTTPPVTTITPELFEAHLAYLDREGYQVWPLDRVIESALTRVPIPDRVVAITFDDAYTSILDTALPLLARYEMPFTLFVATDLVGTNDAIYLTWKQIRELQAGGGLIANHTRTHLHMLRRLEGETEEGWRERMRAEIEGAQETILRETGAAPLLFAYPFGEYDLPLKALVRELGYVALGQQSGPVSGWSDPGALPRFPMSGIYGELASLGEKLATLPLPVTPDLHLVDPLLPLAVTRPTLTVNLEPGDFSRAGLACYASGQGAIPVSWLDTDRFTARAEQPVAVGRSRYNCTLPNSAGNRYRWFSQIWIRKNDDGSWYEE